MQARIEVIDFLDKYEINLALKEYIFITKKVSSHTRIKITIRLKAKLVHNKGIKFIVRKKIQEDLEVAKL